MRGSFECFYVESCAVVWEPLGFAFRLPRSEGSSSIWPSWSLTVGRKFSSRSLQTSGSCPAPYRPPSSAWRYPSGAGNQLISLNQSLISSRSDEIALDVTRRDWDWHEMECLRLPANEGLLDFITWFLDLDYLLGVVEYSAVLPIHYRWIYFTKRFFEPSSILDKW
jgi:hypothetical protein